MNKLRHNNNSGNEANALAPAERRSAQQISEWLTDYLAKTLKIKRTEIDTDAKFERYSVDSLVLVVMTEELESWLEFSIDPTAPFEAPTISSLAKYLEERQDNLNGYPSANNG